MKKLTLTALIAITIVAISCKKEKEPEPEPQRCDTVQSKFAANVFPIFQTNCALSGCHDGSDPDISSRFDSYDNIKAAIENDQTLFLAAINFSGTDEAVWMPRPEPNVAPTSALKLPQTLIDRIECWIERGMPND